MEGRAGAGIVGREPELATADRFLDGAADQFAVLDLVGEPGIGKTTVWREVVGRAKARGGTSRCLAPR